MTVKKINPGDDIQTDVVTMLKQQAARTRRKGNGEESEGEFSAEDTIKLGLGKAINQELNAELLRSERAQKVARIKELVAAGKYEAPLMDVAKSLHDEIVLEILTGDGQAVSDEDGTELL